MGAPLITALRSWSSKPACSTEQIPGQAPKLHRESLSEREREITTYLK